MKILKNPKGDRCDLFVCSSFVTKLKLLLACTWLEGEIQPLIMNHLSRHRKSSLRVSSLFIMTVKSHAMRVKLRRSNSFYSWFASTR